MPTSTIRDRDFAQNDAPVQILEQLYWTENRYGTSRDVEIGEILRYCSTSEGVSLLPWVNQKLQNLVCEDERVVLQMFSNVTDIMFFQNLFEFLQEFDRTFLTSLLGRLKEIAQKTNPGDALCCLLDLVKPYDKGFFDTQFSRIAEFLDPSKFDFNSPSPNVVHDWMCIWASRHCNQPDNV